MLPKIMTANVKAIALRSFLDQIGASVAAADPERLDPDDAIGWIPVRVDSRGRKRIAKILHKAFSDVAEVEAQVQEQVERDPRKAVTMTSGLRLSRLRTKYRMLRMRRAPQALEEPAQGNGALLVVNRESFLCPVGSARMQAHRPSDRNGSGNTLSPSAAG